MKNISAKWIISIFLLATILNPTPALAKDDIWVKHCAGLGVPEDPILADYAFCQCRNSADKAVSAWCDGFFQAVMGLIHDGSIQKLMHKDQCFNLQEYIPDWQGPVHSAFMKKMAACSDQQCLYQKPMNVVIESLVKDYPCRADIGEGEMRGVIAPGE